MANKKITDLSANSSPANADLLEVVDVSDTSMGAGGTNKKITLSSFVTFIITLFTGITEAMQTLADNTTANASTSAHGYMPKLGNNASKFFDGQGAQTNPSTVAAQTYSPSAAATATLDLSLGNEHRITMPAGNITIALSNDTGAQKFIISILQDATGSRTVTWFTTIRWAGGSAPTLTTTASKRDTFGFIRTGSGTYDGFIIGQNI